MNIQALPKLSDFRLAQASGALDFRFDELGIEMESGFSAGRFDGTARVTYWNDPEEGLSWFVNEIFLGCSRWNGNSWDALTVELERDHKLYIDIWGVLTDGAFKDLIDARVREQL